MIRGIITSILEGAIKRLSCTGRAGETFSGREYFQHYGFTSRPLAGAEVIIINEGNNYIGIASDDRRYRLQIQNGEVALYTDEGDKIHLKRNRIIDIVGGEAVNVTTKTATVTASVACNINAPAVTVTASGTCTVASPSIILGEGANRSIVDERLMDLYNNHTHGSDSKPVTKLTANTTCTSITKAA